MSKEFAFVTNIRIAIPVDALVAYPAVFVNKGQAKLVGATDKHVWFEWTSVMYLLNTIENVDGEITRFWVNPE